MPPWLLDWHYVAILFVPLAVFGAFLATPYGAPVLALLSESKLARAVAMFVVTALWVIAARRQSYDAGQASALHDVEDANKRAVERRRQVEIEVAAKPAATNRDRLKEWSR